GAISPLASVQTPRRAGWPAWPGAGHHAVELTQLRSFIAVAKHGHLTRAAESLHLSQPALSAQIKALEESLGVPLFRRLPSGMILTPSGRVLLGSAERVLGALQDLKSAASALQGALTGHFRLGTVL